MMDLMNLSTFDYATIAAIIAAFVTVVGNAFSIDKKYRSLLAVGFGLLFVFIPQFWTERLLTALIIGLTASGVYSQVKPRINEKELMKYKIHDEIKKENDTKNQKNNDTPY
ncbi:hypothetical protein ACFSCX_22495 [Bacillus salitolerans]|uniref:Holin n=1 Tax=Bacillus salitolerans TaxID=1437434 RepID=A0ABW4LWR2_9BACI